MRLSIYLLLEFVRLVACLATVGLWFLLMLMLVDRAPAAPAHRANGTRVARITVYAPDEPRGDYWTRRRKAAIGVRLRDGHCAVDPRLIPYGSTVIIHGKRYLAVDRGGFRGWHIDIYFERWRDAVCWTRSEPDYLPIQIIFPRS